VQGTGGGADAAILFTIILGTLTMAADAVSVSCEGLTESKLLYWLDH
jgi:hypothetical protein